MPLKADPQQRVIGVATWFTAEQLGYLDATQAPREVAWSDLDPERLGPFLTRLADRKDADALLTVASVMIAHDVDARTVESMLAYAERADPAAGERAAVLRAGLQQRDAQPMPEQPADQPDADAEPAAPPHRPWPSLTPEQHEEAIRNIIRTTDEALAAAGHPMEHTQTERFIVYSDLTREESLHWVSLVDKMYDRLCEIFALDKELNIWRGKCLLMFFAKKEDYDRYNASAYESAIEGSAGICRQRGNGDIHILMYRQRNEMATADVLVHEATHGFLARYRSQEHVISWLNEGLAVYVSTVLVKTDSANHFVAQSRDLLRINRRIGNFLTARNIDFALYGLAYDLTDMMIAENRSGYVEMIRGVKDGMPVDEAFKQKYGATIEQVFAYYARTRLDIDNLRLD